MGINYPDLAGIGFHPVTYNYVDNYGCTNRATQVIYVCCVGVEETSATEPFLIFQIQPKAIFRSFLQEHQRLIV